MHSLSPTGRICDSLLSMAASRRRQRENPPLLRKPQAALPSSPLACAWGGGEGTGGSGSCLPPREQQKALGAASGLTPQPEHHDVGSETGEYLASGGLRAKSHLHRWSERSMRRRPCGSPGECFILETRGLPSNKFSLMKHCSAGCLGCSVASSV